MPLKKGCDPERIDTYTFFVGTLVVLALNRGVDVFCTLNPKPLILHRRALRSRGEGGGVRGSGAGFLEGQSILRVLTKLEKPKNAAPGTRACSRRRLAAPETLVPSACFLNSHLPLRLPSACVALCSRLWCGSSSWKMPSIASVMLVFTRAPRAALQED